MVRRVASTAMPRCPASSSTSGEGRLPRTNTMHTMSIMSAVRTTWGLFSPGEQHGLIFHEGQHIAHHVAAAGVVNLRVQPGIRCEQLRGKKLHNVLNGHGGFAPLLCVFFFQYTAKQGQWAMGREKSACGRLHKKYPIVFLDARLELCKIYRKTGDFMIQ